MVNIHITNTDTIQLEAITTVLIEKFGKENIIGVSVLRDKNSEDNRSVVLKLVFKEGLAVHLGEFVVEVSGFCAGFRGTGPYNLLNCLRAAGIDENLLSDEIVYDDRMVIVKEDWRRETAEYGSFRSTDVL